MSYANAENIGDNLAAGIAVVINADRPSSPFHAFGPRSTDALSMSRVECRANSFIRASDQMAMNVAGDYYYNHRRGTVSLTVISQRHTQAGVGPDSTHAQAVGRCRWLLSRAAQALGPAEIGGYELLDTIDQGDNYNKDDATSTDRTELRFQIDLIIPPTIYVAG